jgi:dicarboxylate transporter 10
MTNSIIKTTGFMSLYSGLSAALLRQATYSTVRFSIYEISKTILLERRAKGNLSASADLPFYQKMFLAGLGGGVGSIFGKILV